MRPSLCILVLPRVTSRLQLSPWPSCVLYFRETAVSLGVRTSTWQSRRGRRSCPAGSFTEQEKPRSGAAARQRSSAALLSGYVFASCDSHSGAARQGGLPRASQSRQGSSARPSHFGTVPVVPKLDAVSWNVPACLSLFSPFFRRGSMVMRLRSV